MSDTTETYGLELTRAPESVRTEATVIYTSGGTLVSGIKEAVTISINGTEVLKLDTPNAHGTWTKVVDLTPHVIKGQRNTIKIGTNTYDLEVLGGRIVTEAEVRIRVGRRRLFRQEFECDSGWRNSFDTLVFPG
ncbi:hypothetical protein [Shimia biformata]|uniref:hypothetical protein n=1 Tax=Shimia biformata TaxID=1294299 RepID=UPI00195271B5|nr:hypothetical protein [Shimia biformata]